MTIYREGDKVKLVNRRRIVKVGYDNDPDVYEEEARSAPEIEALRTRLKLDERTIERVIRAVCCGMMASRKRDGNRRRVIFSEDFTDIPHRGKTEFRVNSKHVVYEGVYDGGGWYGDGDYDSPALLQRKAVIVLELVPWSWGISFLREKSQGFHYESGLFVTPDEVVHA